MQTSLATFNEPPWYRRRSKGWSYLALLPARRHLSLYLAIFFLFSILGFYGDIIYCGGRAPFWAVLIVALVNGLYADLYPFVLIYKPTAYLWLLAVGSALQGPIFATWLTHIAATHPVKYGDPRAGTIFAAQGIVIAVIASYSCFIAFIRAQASSALRMQNELELAHGIQRTLVPPIALTTGIYDLHGISVPSDEVGGDLVDVVVLADGAVVAYVADVSGHGLQAGILMGMVKTAARTILLEEFPTPEILLSTFCDRLNRALPGVKESHMYATLAVLHLGQEGTVHYALAGHPAILHYAASSKSMAELACEQFPVGLLPVSSYITQQAMLSPGDIMIVTTDGILEACNATEEEFGEARLSAITTDFFASGTSLEVFSTAVTTAVQAFGKQADDQTLLVIRRQQNASTSSRISSQPQHSAVA